jgi:alkylresorcinol/alkylpyrone synthase
MSSIIGAQTAYPEYRYSQSEVMKLLQKIWPSHSAVLERLRSTSGVEHRNFILPLESYEKLDGFKMRNDFFIEKMLQTLENAILALRQKTGFNWNELGVLTSTTITGIAVPSLDARLMNRLPIPTDVVRTPLFGLGCLGGVAALNRTKDLLKAYPKKLALVLASEACSLTFQFNDVNMANMVACSLFGDGAAAVLMAGDEHPLAKKSVLKIIDSVTNFYPETERIMGWDVIDSGFRVVLSGNVPDIVKKYIGGDVNTLLEKNQLTLSNINNMISHPGGPKVLKALSEILNKEEKYLEHSWLGLKEQGNMSSVSVLNVLERSIDKKTLQNGYALALAMGPAFNSEMSLMRVRDT